MIFSCNAIDKLLVHVTSEKLPASCEPLESSDELLEMCLSAFVLEWTGEKALAPCLFPTGGRLLEGELCASTLRLDAACDVAEGADVRISKLDIGRRCGERAIRCGERTTDDCLSVMIFWSEPMSNYSNTIGESSSESVGMLRFNELFPDKYASEFGLSFGNLTRQSPLH